MEAQQDVIDILRVEVLRAEMRLHDYVQDMCPGQHKVVQHRDGKPPWCRACGRTAMGLLVHTKEEL